MKKSSKKEKKVCFDKHLAGLHLHLNTQGELIHFQNCFYLPSDKGSPFRVTPFWMGFSMQESKQEVTEVISLVNLSSVSSHFNIYFVCCFVFLTLVMLNKLGCHTNF